MRRLSHLSFCIIFLTTGVPAIACDLNGFDGGPPSAEGDETNGTEKTHFAWGSDVDPWGNNYDGSRSWHYVRNIHGKMLSLNWHKPGLLIPFDNPLAEEDCRSVIDYGNAGAFGIDNDAPITTSNDGDKGAVAYVRAEEAAGDEAPNITGTQIRADYRTEDGKRGTAITWLVAYFFPTDQVMEIDVFSGEGGESMAFRPEALGIGVEDVAAQLSEFGVDIIDNKPLGEIVEINELSAAAFEGIADDDFIRISTKESINLKFVDVSEVPSEQTSVLLFSPQGSLLAAKRLATSPLSENRN